VGAAAFAVMLAGAPAAVAHSTLVSTSPVRDRVLEHPPDHVLLRFDEPVETALGSIAVYDGNGERVDGGKITRPAPQALRVAVDEELERGTYTVAWRVISADSDPINGAWVFHVEQPGRQSAGVATQVLEDTPFVVSAAYLGGRFVEFTLLLLCVGGVAALVYALRSAAPPIRRRLLGFLATLAAALTVMALLGLGLQAAAAGGGTLADGFRWEAISSVADTRYGHFTLARAALAAALCAVALLVARRAVGTVSTEGADDRGRDGRFVRGRAETNGPLPDAPLEHGGAAGERSQGDTLVETNPALAQIAPAHTPVAHSGPRRGRRREVAPAVVMSLLAAGLVVTPGLSGHASVSGPVSIVADAAHVQAAAAWTGALAFVVLALVVARGRRWELAAASVPRFSTMAVVSVAILLIAGTINGYLQVRAWRGLWETEYGVLLLVKIGLVLPLLALGAYNNRFAVPRLRAQVASVVDRRRFLRLAGVELVIMLAVVGVTAALVNAPPARTEISMHEASEKELRLGPMRASLEVMPGEVGSNEIHLEFNRGRPDEVRVSVGLSSKRIGPLRYRARPGMAPGSYVVRRANLAPAGEWELRIEARRGKFDLYTEKVQIEIGKEM
jgi:copper transport protein